MGRKRLTEPDTAWPKDERVKRAVEAIRALLDEAGGIAAAASPPTGYPHPGLSLLDSVYSLNAHYRSAENVVARYCAAVPEICDCSSFDSPHAEPEHDLAAQQAFLGAMSDRELAELLNGQLALGTTTLKARVVVQVGATLIGAGISTSDELRARVNDLNLTGFHAGVVV